MAHRQRRAVVGRAGEPGQRRRPRSRRWPRSAIGALPADANHPYGHDKAEYFSVGARGRVHRHRRAVDLQHGLGRLRDPRPIAQPVEGLAVNALASAAQRRLGDVLVRDGRRPPLAGARSPTACTCSPTWSTSVGVVVGLVLAVLTGWLVLDPLLAALVGGQHPVVGLASDPHVDRRTDGRGTCEPQTLERIRALIAENAAGAIEAHDIRTRHAGRLTFIEFHLVVPGTMPVSESHEICDRIEGALRAEIADLDHHHPRRAGGEGEAARSAGAVSRSSCALLFLSWRWLVRATGSGGAVRACGLVEPVHRSDAGAAGAREDRRTIATRSRPRAVVRRTTGRSACRSCAPPPKRCCGCIRI